MTYIDHDLGPQGPSRAPAKPVTTQRTPAGAHSPLLDLQRLAGNAAVSGAVRDGRFDSSVPVQRLADGEDEGYENEVEEENDAEEELENAEEEGEEG